MADTQVRHKPGIFKQPNKCHKTGRHKSKGQLQKEAKGRVNVKSITKSQKSALRKAERVNRTQQLRKQKRDEVLSKKRTRGSHGNPPFLVAVVSLCDGLDTEAAVKVLRECNEENKHSLNDLGVHHVSVPRFKQRFSFVLPKYGDLYSTLDAAKVADAMLFLLSPDDGVDSYGEHCLACLSAQGMPAPVVTIQGLSHVPLKNHGNLKKRLQKQLKNQFPDVKFHSIDTSQDALLVLRTIGQQKLKELTYRDRRPHLLVEAASFFPNEDGESMGTLRVTGYLRGRALSANSLVYIPGWDTYQISQIDAAKEQTVKGAVKHRENNNMDTEEEEAMDEEVNTLERADPLRQTSLQSEVVPDPMEGEQTWPTEEEIRQAEAECLKKSKKQVKKVPKGTSEYQAAWIVESDEENDLDLDDQDDSEDDLMSEGDDSGDDDDDDDDDDAEEEEDAYSYDGSQREDTEIMTIDGDVEKYDKMVDLEEEESMLQKLKQARLNQMFPDEVDTPQDVPARDRFQRYRGLKSFRTSKWDVKEDLPLDYARIYQFENFKRSKKRALVQKEDHGALPGWYITVHIVNVPRQYMDSYSPGSPLTIFGLLEHEQKMSVMHFLLKRPNVRSDPIKSKERLTFHVGFRRFTACPVFSQHTNSDKHKFERYLGDMTVATVFAPVTFPPAPVLVFRDGKFGAHELVAGGSVLAVNPDRTIIKRVVLSGHPLKINKKSAVVRYMFFTRDDIKWFKPVELRTKWGRRGHIKEPLGTHGHMKCIFDNQLKSQDTVMMNLYKRVYPKWTFESRVPSPSCQDVMSAAQQEEIFTEI